ncbi:unnamed protein product, partial [Meganyctiphanes norvegica]
MTKQLNFTFDVSEPCDLNPKTGEWNGNVREISSSDADASAVAFSKTSDRNNTTCSDTLMISIGALASILYGLNSNTNEFLKVYWLPFALDVWICTLAVIPLVALAMLITVAAKGRPEMEENNEDEDISFRKGVWFAATTLMQQGQENTPERGPARIVFGLMWAISVLMYAHYTSNLMSYFTITKPHMNINNL